MATQAARTQRLVRLYTVSVRCKPRTVNVVCESARRLPVAAFKISHWFMTVGAHRDAPVKHRDAPVKHRDAPVKHRNAPVTSGSSRTAPPTTRKFEAITLSGVPLRVYHRRVVGYPF